jgi:hypothetical protein
MANNDKGWPFKPTTEGFRDPMDRNRTNGQFINPPRTAQLGGLDQLKEPHGHYKNSMTLEKYGVNKQSKKVKTGNLD